MKSILHINIVNEFESNCVCHSRFYGKTTAPISMKYMNILSFLMEDRGYCDKQHTRELSLHGKSKRMYECMKIQYSQNKRHAITNITSNCL